MSAIVLCWGHLNRLYHISWAETKHHITNWGPKPFRWDFWCAKLTKGGESLFRTFHRIQCQFQFLIHQIHKFCSLSVKNGNFVLRKGKCNFFRVENGAHYSPPSFLGWRMGPIKVPPSKWHLGQSDSEKSLYSC